MARPPLSHWQLLLQAAERIDFLAATRETLGSQRSQCTHINGPGRLWALAPASQPASQPYRFPPLHSLHSPIKAAPSDDLSRAFIFFLRWIFIHAEPLVGHRDSCVAVDFFFGTKKEDQQEKNFDSVNSTRSNSHCLLPPPPSIIIHRNVCIFTP